MRAHEAMRPIPKAVRPVYIERKLKAPVMNGTNKPQIPVNTFATDGFAALDIAPFDGWNMMMLTRAARDAGVDRSAMRPAFPGGVRDLLRYWSAQSDAAMTAQMAGPAFKNLKIREKVAFAVRARLAALGAHKEAARRAAAVLALPVYGSLGARLAWSTSDAIWRGLGDTSTDFNFYSKRTILTGLWGSVFARWLGDDSESQAATNAFLDARIDNVMQIEKAKARIRDLRIDPLKPVEMLARLRYPAAKER